MFDNLSRNAITAKARAMYGNRITARQFDDMIKLNSVSEVATYLKNETHYSSVLSGIQPKMIHRGQLENLLKRELYEEYSRLYHYLYSNREDFFKYEIMEEDIKEILRMILLIKSGNAQTYILDLPAYLISKSTLDLLAMAKVQTYDELVQVLERTRYEPIIKKYRPTPESPTIDYISCEHAFFDFYFNNIIKTIKQSYTGKERTQLLDLIGLRIELMNISIIYRSKAYFNTPSTEIVDWIYHYYYKLSAKKMGVLSQAQDKKELDHLLSQTYLHKKMGEIDFDYIEHFVYNLYHHAAQKYFRFSTFSSVSFHSFAMLRSIELINITTIIEGIRYNISKDNLQNYIIT